MVDREFSARFGEAASHRRHAQVIDLEISEAVIRVQVVVLGRRQRRQWQGQCGNTDCFVHAFLSLVRGKSSRSNPGWRAMLAPRFLPPRRRRKATQRWPGPRPAPWAAAAAPRPEL